MPTKRQVKRKTKNINTAKRPTARVKTHSESANHYVVTTIILGVLALLFGAILYLGDNAGVVGNWLRTGLFGLFASTAYLIPVALLALCIYTARRADTKRFRIKALWTTLCVVDSAAIIQLLYSDRMPAISYFWESGTKCIGGGFIGGLLAYGMNLCFGKAVSLILLFVALFALISLIFKVSFISIIKSFIGGMKEEIDEIEPVDVSEQGKKIKKLAKKKKSEQKEPEEVKSVYDGDDKYDIFKGVKEEEKEEFDADKFIKEVAEQLPQTEEVKKILEENTPKQEETQKAEATTAEERAEVSDEINSAIEEKKEYAFPPLDLLNKPKQISGDKRTEMKETSIRLMETLKNFGIEAKLVQITNGPAVTRYEIQPNIGIKLSKITGLAEDIALNLAVPTVLVAPVPNKTTVGIEVPNTSVGIVSVRELIESDEFQKTKSKLAITLGKDIAGKVIIGDIAKFPHILIAGSTGSGKSVCINTIITSILYNASPDDVKLIMVDPKVVELGVYNGIPHLLIPVVTDPKRAAGSLNWAVGEMMRRYQLFAESGTRNLEGYNNYLKKEGGEKLPQIVIIIDELADLMMVAAKEVEDYICRLAQLARAAGIHLIIATQRPSVDVITGLIKANVPSRIAFAVSSAVDSRIIIDHTGAERLLGKGDMLYHPVGAPSATRVQGAFVTDDEVERVVEFVKQNADDSHYAEDLAEQLERIATGENGVTDKDDGDDADALLPQAIQLALDLGQISTVMVQRKLKVGYARAGRIVDQMETRGLISGANGSKPREVYMDRIRAAMSEEYTVSEDD